ncbi:hypothetical protein A7K93_09055 [Candidatus Methylacidiphilum fumarolicum]|uniref:hypothetical protein n=1 Tax=Candidatus Methylacidiphilum fumarolicum TaxID=591154 RepID=UPI000662827A|nr:hypothetical protein [Candidatus Methylacidiphilum fumarolicum]MBW6415263.1 hypothetical protein [Candidatus Methylacidiphilum fumarolicum]TFE72232.1 hypothetical protein A7K72_09315 [Candidatus Methylacidiphilum fumarolicum]TFE72373.1 hypothetical protein A7K93_09055 [Candidatus Methylacidiphilum fumarolicum]
MNSYCYYDANLVINRHRKPIFAEEVWRVDRSKPKQAVEKEGGRGGIRQTVSGKPLVLPS